MTSPRSIPQLCMFSAAWLVSAGPPCLAGGLSVQTVINWSTTAPLNPPASDRTGATIQGQPAVPRLQNASGQWMPSCFLPRSTEWSTLRCIQEKTTGEQWRDNLWVLFNVSLSIFIQFILQQLKFSGSSLKAKVWSQECCLFLYWHSSMTIILINSSCFCHFTAGQLLFSVCLHHLQTPEQQLGFSLGQRS